ncbi:MAG: hypothetical protein IJ741_05555 [Schwartzia sp.]|nr:hypothetical protein [Schwartzia sp. (in: firmicutes)]
MGDAVWTDGRVIYGNEFPSAGELLLFSDSGGGIPVAFGKQFYILSAKDGKIKKSYAINADVDIVGFVNNEQSAFVELTSDNGKTVDWYDLETGTLVYTSDERAADAQIETVLEEPGEPEASESSKENQGIEVSCLLTLEVGDIVGYKERKNIGLYKSGSLAVPLPTANEVAGAGLDMLLAEAESSDGNAYIQGHSGRITKGGNFYTTLANFSGHAKYLGPEIQLSSHAAVQVSATMDAQGRAYTENGALTWAQFSTNIQNPTAPRIPNGYVNETAADEVIPVLHGVGAVTTWVDPYLNLSAPILILISGGDNFVTAFPFEKEMYENEEQYWDAWGQCILLPDGSQFIKKKGDELLGGYVKPRSVYFYYTNTTANDTSTYRDRFPLNDDFVSTRSGDKWSITDGGKEVYSASSNFRQASLYRLRDGGYLLQNGSTADKIFGGRMGFICGSRNYRFCPMPDAEGVFRRLEKLIYEQYGMTEA